MGLQHDVEFEYLYRPMRIQYYDITRVDSEDMLYPIQKISEIYNEISEMYNKISELKISSWNVLSLLRSEVAYIGTGPILP